MAQFDRKIYFQQIHPRWLQVVTICWQFFTFSLDYCQLQVIVLENDFRTPNFCIFIQVYRDRQDILNSVLAGAATGLVNGAVYGTKGVLWGGLFGLSLGASVSVFEYGFQTVTHHPLFDVEKVDDIVDSPPQIDYSVQAKAKLEAELELFKEAYPNGIPQPNQNNETNN